MKKEIKIGEEVLNGHTCMIVTKASTDQQNLVRLVDHNGDTYKIAHGLIKKTGNHYPQMEQLLSELRRENEKPLPEFPHENSDEIVQGDEVLCGNMKMAVVRVPSNPENLLRMIDCNGETHMFARNLIRKTGKHYPQVVDMLTMLWHKNWTRGTE